MGVSAWMDACSHVERGMNAKHVQRDVGSNNNLSTMRRAACTFLNSQIPCCLESFRRIFR